MNLDTNLRIAHYSIDKFNKNKLTKYGWLEFKDKP